MFAYVNSCRRTTLDIHFVYLGKKEIYPIFKTCYVISVLFSTKWHFFLEFIFFCSRNTCFVKHTHPGRIQVNPSAAAAESIIPF